jgi:hypothetical protein
MERKALLMRIALAILVGLEGLGFASEKRKGGVSTSTRKPCRFTPTSLS